MTHVVEALETSWLERPLIVVSDLVQSLRVVVSVFRSTCWSDGGNVDEAVEWTLSAPCTELRHCSLFSACVTDNIIIMIIIIFV